MCILHFQESSYQNAVAASISKIYESRRSDGTVCDASRNSPVAKQPEIFRILALHFEHGIVRRLKTAAGVSVQADVGQ